VNNTARWNLCVVMFRFSYDLLPALCTSVVEPGPKTAINNEPVKIALTVVQ